MNNPLSPVVTAALGLLLIGSIATSLPPVRAQNARRPPAKKPAAPAALVAQGRIKALTRSPRPGSVPYRDAVIALHLTGAKALRGGRLPGGSLLIYVWGMKDNKLTPAASYRPGQTITLALQPWEKAEETYGGYNRVDFEDEDLLALPTYWGQVTPAARR